MRREKKNRVLNKKVQVPDLPLVALPSVFFFYLDFFFKMLATSETTKTTANNVWDTKTQTFHGGQEHRFINNFVEDFSVTTNYLGTPRKALEAAKEAVSSNV